MATATGVAVEDVAQGAKKGQDAAQVSQWRLMVRRFLQNKLSVLGGVVLLLLYGIAAIAPFLAPYHYDETDSNANFAAPTSLSFAGGRPSVCGVKQVLDEATFTYIYSQDCSQRYPVEFFVRGYQYKILGLFPTTLHLFGVREPAKLNLFGADRDGRDVFSRVLQGSRVSLTIGLVGVGIATALGSVLGTASGYFGGAIDNVMQRTIELIQSVPTLPLWAALATAFPRDMPVTQRYLAITVILSLVAWTGLARQVRGKVMGYRTADYTNATLAAGGSHTRIILTHMLPNAVSHIIVVSALAIPGAILAETALSFLGLGMLPPAVSWGVLLRDAQEIQSVTAHPWLLLPALAVIIALTCWQFLGDGLRDAADPYS